MSGKGNSPRCEHRANALWGTGNRGGDSRSNALWGKGGPGLVTALCAVLVVAAPLAAGAHKTGNQELKVGSSTYIDPILLAKAKTNPNELVKVIIQSDEGAGRASKAFEYADHSEPSQNDDGEKLNRTLTLVGAVAVDLKAAKMHHLARIPGLTVTYDARVKLSSLPTSKQVWPTASGVRPLWGNQPAAGQKVPSIAIIDSGIEKNRADFDMGARVIAEKVITTLVPNSSGDGRGHGTFVAGIAAGSAVDYAGAAPQANIVSVDVMDDSGMARTSDVIAGAEWVYQNRQSLNIKVANFSLHSTMPSNFINDPLDKAVEKLWYGGITVVVAAGNYGRADGLPSGVPYAPGNDPFVITVGALDLDGKVGVGQHEAPTWSAYGYTKDGFRKPELAAAGRYMIGPVPTTSTLARDKASNIVSSGYIRLSGTSFAAPIVAGAAAQLLIKHPDWTPDQIKAARSILLTSPPNPNTSLNRFVKADALLGTKTFDGSAWYTAAKASASWDSVSWSDASWSDVSWSDASWSDVSWSDVLAAADVSWEDAAQAEVSAPDGDYLMTPEEEAAALGDPTLNPDATTATATTSSP